MTVGGKPNTDFLKGGLVPLNAKGFIEVTECLQVKGYHNIYALGDATDIKETKLGYLAAAHARLTAMNLRRRFRYGDAAEQQVWIPFGGFEVGYRPIDVCALQIMTGEPFKTPEPQEPFQSS
eukprot:TRINITY_DN846_c0_g1_i3.p1 TRINITY_DN846_c0_g1~~TRINITY_DN846_c0_g1_i3.p1  ORF type:complete len:122 (+),score=11.38 TRINITY_DN846_c0_g1_i3:379-744(+)